MKLFGIYSDGSHRMIVDLCRILVCAVLVTSCGCRHPKTARSNIPITPICTLAAKQLDLVAPDVVTPSWLDQHWSEKQRQQFYTISQGSQMMPLSWFLSLERPETAEPFLSDGLRRFGYLPNPRGPLNPYGLPVGFTIDSIQSGGPPQECPTGPSSAGRPVYWVGMTCAACHTGQVSYKGITKLIDGGPTGADLLALIQQINLALQATLKDEAKFARFADKVSGSNTRRRRDLQKRADSLFGLF